MFGDSLMNGSCVTGHSPYWRGHHDSDWDDDDDNDDLEIWDDDDDDDLEI